MHTPSFHLSSPPSVLGHAPAAQTRRGRHRQAHRPTDGHMGGPAPQGAHSTHRAESSKRTRKREHSNHARARRGKDRHFTVAPSPCARCSVADLSCGAPRTMSGRRERGCSDAATCHIALSSARSFPLCGAVAMPPVLASHPLFLLFVVADGGRSPSAHPASLSLSLSLVAVVCYVCVCLCLGIPRVARAAENEDVHRFARLLHCCRCPPLFLSLSLSLFADLHPRLKSAAKALCHMRLRTGDICRRPLATLCCVTALISDQHGPVSTLLI